MTDQRQWCRFCDVWHSPFNGHVCAKEDLIKHVVSLERRASNAEIEANHLREFVAKTQTGKKHILSERVEATGGYRRPVDTTHRRVVEVLFATYPWAIVREGRTAPYICDADDLHEIKAVNNYSDHEPET